MIQFICNYMGLGMHDGSNKKIGDGGFKMTGIIVFGEKGSGKDTVAKLISECSLKKSSFFNVGDLVRDMSCIFLATDKWDNNKREFYIETAKKLKEYDINFLSLYVKGRILEKFEKVDLKEIDDENLIIVTGGRTEEDYEFWKENGFTVVGIKCTDEVRQLRLKERDGYLQNSEDSLEENTKKIIAKSDYIIDNSGTKKELEIQIKSFIREYISID